MRIYAGSATLLAMTYVTTYPINAQAEDAHARGLAEGLAQGEAKGREEGRKQERLEIARNLKALGVEISMIVQSSGLSEEQITTL